MLTRLIEHLLIGGLNRAIGRRRSHPEAPAVPEPLPEGATVIGHALGDDGAVTGRRVALAPESFRRHLYLLGATGTGKTNLLLRLIESDIASRRSFCVIDLRGDLVDRILPRLAASAPAGNWRERLLLMDLRQTGHVVGFNPLAGEGDGHSRALHLLAVLKYQSDSWGVQLEETLRNGLIALAESGDSVLELEPLLTDKGFRSAVLQRVKDDRVRSFFERYSRLTPANQMTWSLAVLNKVSPLLSVPALRLTFGQRGALSFRELMDTREGMVVLVALAVDRLHDAAKLAGGLLVSSFQTAIMARADVPESERVPVNLYVDEFECMASDRFEAIVAEGRRFGLGLTLSHQNVSQLTPSLRNVLRNNIHTQVYFQTGAIDARELAREIGGNAAEMRAALTSQAVGQAYLIRRGQPSVRVQTLPSHDPKVTKDQIRALKEVSYASFARPARKVEAEFAARERERAGATVPEVAAPVYEIRHSKPKGMAQAEPASATEFAAAGTPGRVDDPPQLQEHPPVRTRPSKRSKTPKVPKSAIEPGLPGTEEPSAAGAAAKSSRNCQKEKENPNEERQPPETKRNRKQADDPQPLQPSTERPAAPRRARRAAAVRPLPAPPDDEGAG